MYTQEITPTEAHVRISIPKKYVGHKLTITVTETEPLDEFELDHEKYSMENWDKFIAAHPADLSNFKFDREEANER